MTSLQISYFLKVAECMSFSQAAQELFVTQPSVSRQIQMLEKELGYTLFDRSRKNAISLTGPGMVFRDGFIQSRRCIEDARAAARKLAGQPLLRLRLGIGEYWDMTAELSLFEQLVARRYPQAKLEFESSSFALLRSRLHSGALDAILCTKTSLTDFDGIDVLPVCSIRCRAYVRRGLLRPEDEELHIEDFNGLDLLMLSEDESPMAMELAQMQFLASQVKLQSVYLPNRDTILQAVLMGKGTAVFDEYMRFRDDPRLTYISLYEPIPLCVVRRKGDANPLIPYFAESFRQLIEAD